MVRTILLSASLCLFTVHVHGSDCTPTSPRSTGTHYEPVTEEKQDVSAGMLVRVRVLAAPDCRPVSGAKVVHWQAGEDGRYADRLRAYWFTDDDGRLEFETEWPNLESPHIHFLVTAEGYEQLATQWVGDTRQETIEFTIVLEAR